MRVNSIVASLRRWDDEAVTWLNEQFPEDGLVIRVYPLARWGSAV